MSCWLLFASIGIYPLAGTEWYVLGSPSVASATLAPFGTDVRIKVVAHDWSEAAVYVEGAAWNGQALVGGGGLSRSPHGAADGDAAALQISHAQLMQGGTLEFWMREV